MSEAVGTRFARPPALLIVDAAKFDNEVEQRIAAFWNLEIDKTTGNLWDGPVLRMVSATTDLVMVTRTSYRFLMAARAGIDTGETFLALGVTCLLACRDGLVFGLRGEDMSSLGNHWECAPSGSAETDDLVADLFLELQDELGIDPQLAGEVEHLGLVVDSAECVADYVFALSVDLTGKEIQRLHRVNASKEYSAIAIVPTDRLTNFLHDHAGRVVPHLPVILSMAQGRAAQSGSGSPDHAL